MNTPTTPIKQELTRKAYLHKGGFPYDSDDEVMSVSYAAIMSTLLEYQTELLKDFDGTLLYTFSRNDRPIIHSPPPTGSRKRARLFDKPTSLKPELSAIENIQLDLSLLIKAHTAMTKRLKLLAEAVDEIAQHQFDGSSVQEDVKPQIHDSSTRDNDDHDLQVHADGKDVGSQEDGNSEGSSKDGNEGDDIFSLSL